ncbi:lipoprotein [Actinokineospora iranica]|uniref:Uncharacterized protein n=1 Tax=Actinokineospora iranica TaxID=1271860 RepID=A0A1G6N700_9PSEU|nr:lipoprotein [Actinokineospora iranica]SDC62905.1 hypothetical protein SAMN05216174_103199 [Actinokineospora iranica]
MGRIGHYAAIVLTAGVVSACAGGGTQPGDAPATTPPSSSAATGDVWDSAVRPASAAARVGTPQACPMPFAFDVSGGWTPRPNPPAEPRDGLEAACDLVADPAYLRVWIGTEAGSSPRGALERFLQGEGEITEPHFRDTQIGKGSGVEVTYEKPGDQRGRAFAVATPLRTIVVEVGAENPADYAKALPGYLLAKDSLTPIER